jgi:hypothetical protein
MRLSLIAEADYNDLHDKKAMTRETLVDNFRILAARIEADYKDHKSEQEKYGVFYQIYRIDVGGSPKSERSDSASQGILNLIQGGK